MASKQSFPSPSHRRVSAAQWPTPPRGLNKIIKTFGDPRGSTTSLEPSPAWEAKCLARARVPLPLILGWMPGRTVTSFRCHTLLVPVFERVFGVLHDCGLDHAVTTFDGCYNFRRRRSGARLSSHSWGIAVDLNASINRMGSRGDQYPQLVGIFRDFGFEWGGDWSGRRRDPMHFQFCTGY